jgi:hypothetical protein
MNQDGVLAARDGFWQFDTFSLIRFIHEPFSAPSLVNWTNSAASNKINSRKLSERNLGGQFWQT